MEPEGTPVIEGPFRSRPSPTGEAPAMPADAVLLHLTGPHRGTRQRLTGPEVLVGASRDALVHFPANSEPAVALRHAVIVRGEEGWSIREEDGQIYVNSSDVPGLHGRETLAPGDILEIGDGGPVVRFLMEAARSRAYKSVRETIRDVVDCSRHSRGGRLGRLAYVARKIPRELLTRTSPRARLTVAGLLVVGVVGASMLAAYALRLERRLDAEERRSAMVEEALGALAGLAEGDPELRALVGELETVLTERIAALEALSDAGRRIVTEASGSVLFVQGGYHFVEPETGRALRRILGPQGRPMAGPGGMPFTALDGDGPLFEVQFTGSAWLAAEDGLLVTNRHLAVPWSANREIAPLLEQGLEPRLRLLAYLPGEAESLEMEVVRVSSDADLAVLRSEELAERLTPLSLAASGPVAGQEIVVLGYPAGIDALLARSGTMFVDSLMHERPDFWAVVRGLSEAGFIQPLATRGIVGQVTPFTVAYDAETTRGGSGGPVLSLDGEVVAVTFAVMADFGGSNLGVPIEHVHRLLDEAREDLEAPDQPGSAAAARQEPVVPVG